MIALPGARVQRRQEARLFVNLLSAVSTREYIRPVSINGGGAFGLVQKLG